MKKSSRAARMERHHKRTANASLSLVSLMDIFTILVFFLLVNSSSVQQLPSSKVVKLPQSIAEKLPSETIVVMVSATDILVHGRKVATIADVLADDQGRVIEPLKEELMFQAGEMWDKDALADIDGAAITIMADKQVPYKLLRRIMLTMADTPYKKISLAVSKKPKQAGEPKESGE